MRGFTFGHALNSARARHPAFRALQLDSAAQLRDIYGHILEIVHLATERDHAVFQQEYRWIDVLDGIPFWYSRDRFFAAVSESLGAHAPDRMLGITDAAVLAGVPWWEGDKGFNGNALVGGGQVVLVGVATPSTFFHLNDQEPGSFPGRQFEVLLHVDLTVAPQNDHWMGIILGVPGATTGAGADFYLVRWTADLGSTDYTFEIALVDDGVIGAYTQIGNQTWHRPELVRVIVEDRTLRVQNGEVRGRSHTLLDNVTGDETTQISDLDVRWQTVGEVQPAGLSQMLDSGNAGFAVNPAGIFSVREFLVQSRARGARQVAIGGDRLSDYDRIPVPEWINQLAALKAITATGEIRVTVVRREKGVRELDEMDVSERADLQDGRLRAFLVRGPDGWWLEKDGATGTAWTGVTDLRFILSGFDFDLDQAGLETFVPLPSQAFRFLVERIALDLGHAAPAVSQDRDWMHRTLARLADYEEKFLDWVGDVSMTDDESFHPEVS